MTTITRKQRITRAFSCMLASILCVIFSLSAITMPAAAASITTSDFLEFICYYNANSTNDALKSKLTEVVKGTSGSDDTTGDLTEPTDDTKICAKDGSVYMEAYDSASGSAIEPSLLYKAIEFAAYNYTNKYVVAKNTPKLYNIAATAAQLKSAFPKYSDFAQAFKTLVKYDWEADFGTFIMNPAGKTISTEITSIRSSFDSKLTSGAINSSFEDTFDITGFNPDSDVANAALSGITKIVSDAFAIISNLILILFMFQTACDILYITAEPIRPFLTKGGEGGGLGSNAGGSGVLSKLRLPICSSSAVEACGASGGGIGGNNGGAGRSNILIKYVTSRAPVIILCAVYLILTASGYWFKAISWVAGFITQIFNWIFTLGT